MVESEAKSSKAGGGGEANVLPRITPRRVVIPSDPHDRMRMWLLLIISVGLCLPAMLVELGASDTRGPMEHIALLSSQETWVRQELGRNAMLRGLPLGPADATQTETGAVTEAGALADPEAWLIPSWNGRDRVNKPPMLVWLNLLAWSDLDPRTATTDQLTHRARLVGVALAALALMCVFWAGLSLGDLRVATVATVVCGTCFAFTITVREATYDTHLLGWVTLAVAAGLWAMRPMKPANPVARRVIGWLICGIALFAAAMTKGPPLALMWVLGPLVAAIVIIPRRRLGNAFGLLFATCVGMSLTAPWYLYVMHAMGGEAMGIWSTEWQSDRPESDPIWYYTAMILWVLPWTIWLIGALFQPFLRARGERRRQLLVAWLWLVVMIVLLSTHEAKKVRYILPAFPAVGLMIGQLWAWHAQLASEGRMDPGVNVLRWPHWIGQIVVAVALPAFWITQDRWVDAGHLDQILLWTHSTWSILGLGAGLLFFAVIGLWWHWRWRPILAALATVLFMQLTMLAVMVGYVHGPKGDNAYRADAERVAQRTMGEPMYYLYDPRQDPLADRNPAPQHVEPNEEFLFYARRIVPPVHVDELDQLTQKIPSFYVMTIPDEVIEAKMQALNFEPVTSFIDDKRPPIRRLYRYRSPALRETPPLAE